jgi:anhydro-N-acetylmuramic acid kinase
MFVSSLYLMAGKRGSGSFDLLATATALTASSIGQAYREFVLPRFGKVDEIYFAGGGRKNHTLMEMLGRELSFAEVGVIEKLGFDGDGLEAQAFALLACEAVERVPGNLSRVTGARRQVVLGKIVPGRNYLGVRLK